MRKQTINIPLNRKMNFQAPDRSHKEHWESGQVCPKCERFINLADIDLLTVTSGVLDCPNCDWSGPIEIQVIDGSSQRK
jgi:hypothetical protein